MANNVLVFITKAQNKQDAKDIANSFMELAIPHIGDYYEITNEVHGKDTSGFIELIRKAVKARRETFQFYRKNSPLSKYDNKYKQYAMLSGRALFGSSFIYDNVYNFEFRLSGGLKHLNNGRIYAVYVRYHY